MTRITEPNGSEPTATDHTSRVSCRNKSLMGGMCMYMTCVLSMTLVTSEDGCFKMLAGIFYWNKTNVPELKFSVSPEPVTLPALKAAAPLPRKINLQAANGEKPNLVSLSTCCLLPVAAFCHGNDMNIHAEKPVKWGWTSHHVRYFIFSTCEQNPHVITFQPDHVVVSSESVIIKIIIICERRQRGGEEKQNHHLHQNH